jgi:DNA repair exonuclease SbcCD nuclease subunit
LVLLGHYHKPQEVKSGATTAMYVGSPVQLDWGEKGDEKRFLVVDSEKLELESIPTEGYKKHIELEINSANKTKVLKEAEKIAASGDYVKLIKTDEVDLKKYAEAFCVVDKTEKDVTDRGISSNMSQAERMKRFVEIKKIPEGDIEEYMSVGLNIIDRVERAE